MLVEEKVALSVGLMAVQMVGGSDYLMAVLKVGQ